MPIEKQPFVPYKEEEERSIKDKTFTTRLTASDLKWFKPAKEFIKQPKNSTAMKQLAEIGSIVVLHDKKVSQILEVVSANISRNKRLGIPDLEFEEV